MTEGPESNTKPTAIQVGTTFSSTPLWSWTFPDCLLVNHTLRSQHVLKKPLSLHIGQLFQQHATESH